MSLPNLTIAYMTNRREPHVRWFLESLGSPPQSVDIKQMAHKIVMVDFWHKDRDADFKALMTKYGVIHVPPKPCVWQGEHRLTKVNWFAASNARNTALCLAPDGYIAYVDDLSVLTPLWLHCVVEAMEHHYIVYGAYRKVLGLIVENGIVQGFRDHPPGDDSRWKYGKNTGPVVAAGSWLFGCSLAAPVEAFLAINGWDEDADGLGGEDSAAGIMLERAGYTFRYDRRMLTYESEEGHHTGEEFVRSDKGRSPKDKSHAFLNMLLGGRNIAPNYFGYGGIKQLRQKVLNGAPFPIVQVPQHDWYDGQPISEMEPG